MCIHLLLMKCLIMSIRSNTIEMVHMVLKVVLVGMGQLVIMLLKEIQNGLRMGM